MTIKELFVKKEKENESEENHLSTKPVPPINERSVDLNAIEEFFVEKEEKLKGIQFTFQIKKV